jgi:hypothetical protein
MTNYVIRNQTMDKLVLEGKGNVFKLPPLQRTRIGENPVQALGQAARAADRDNAVVWEPEPIRSSRLYVITWCAALGILSLLTGLFLYALGAGVLFLAAGVALAVLLGVAALAVTWQARGQHDSAQELAADGDTLRPGPVRAAHWDFARDFFIGSAHGAVLVIVLVLGIGAPAAAIYFGTELFDVLKFQSWNHLTVDPASYGVVVGRALLLLTVILVSLFPALMYFQFDREKLPTQIDRWLHAIFRLDPSLETVADVDAKYGRRVEEFYGATLGAGVDLSRKRARSRSPIVVATLMIGTGWILLLLGHADTKLDLSISPGVQRLFQPPMTPLTAAFLGAYFLAVQVALRGYVRGDLRPKTYNVITVRIILAVISAWILQGLFGDGRVVLAMCFLSGFVPNTVIRRIREVTQRGLGQPGVPGLPSKREQADDFFEDTPLTVLDGMDIYERTRLEEEGITGVQALARHDLIDLILSSRIPVPRLIDWLDQALLYQHAGDAIEALRKRGVRTATDFLQVYEDVDSALPALMAGADAPAIEPALLARALDHDEWLAYVSNWRSYAVVAPPRERRYGPDGRLSFSTPAASSGVPARSNGAPGKVARRTNGTPARTRPGHLFASPRGAARPADSRLATGEGADGAPQRPSTRVVRGDGQL